MLPMSLNASSADSGCDPPLLEPKLDCNSAETDHGLHQTIHRFALPAAACPNSGPVSDGHGDLACIPAVVQLSISAFAHLRDEQAQGRSRCGSRRSTVTTLGNSHGGSHLARYLSETERRNGGRTISPSPCACEGVAFVSWQLRKLMPS